MHSLTKQDIFLTLTFNIIFFKGCERVVKYVVESVVENKVSLHILYVLQKRPEVTFPGKEDASQAFF